MASDFPNSVDEEVPSTSSDKSGHAKAKLKRRRTKREGPPKLQFLIATNPSHFKNEDAKRSVRSQAMIHWRHEEGKKKRKDSLEDHVVSGPSTEYVIQDARSDAPLPASTLRRKPQKQSQPCHSTLQIEQPQHDRLAIRSQPWTGRSWSSTLKGSLGWQSTSPEAVSYLSQHQDKTHSAAARRVVQYEESERHGERQLQTLVAGLAAFYNVGSSYDPFNILPKFRNPHLDAQYLMRHCMRAFTSESTMVKWLPSMLSHPHIILSSTILASTWLDMHNKWSGDSAITVMIKTETIVMINERFSNHTLQLDDATLVVILHLFAGEMWVCNEQALRAHETGIATLVARRGGLLSFIHNRAIAEVAAACCYHCDIFCETETLPTFQHWSPANFVSIDDDIALPESPLFCPRHDYLTVARDARCSQPTLDILSDMRDLTDIFLEHSAILYSTPDNDVADTPFTISHFENYETKTNEIRTRLSLLPSARSSGLLVTGDWMYEACRIAALIYTIAITMGIPFSVAADPSYSGSLETMTTSFDQSGDKRAYRIPLTEALNDALKRSDTSTIWNNMSGVLYWVSAVGAAAARAPNLLSVKQQDRVRNGARSLWIRRCLIMTATRTMIMLVFEHPTATITAQRTLLRIQELIGSYMQTSQGPSHGRQTSV